MAELQQLWTPSRQLNLNPKLFSYNKIKTIVHCRIFPLQRDQACYCIMALFVLATLFRQLGLDKHATEALLTRCRVVALSLSRYKKIVAFLKKFPRFFWRNNNYYAPDMMIITTRVFHTNQSSGLITNSSQWGWHKGKNILILAQQLLWFTDLDMMVITTIVSSK